MLPRKSGWNENMNSRRVPDTSPRKVGLRADLAGVSKGSLEQRKKGEVTEAQIPQLRKGKGSQREGGGWKGAFSSVLRQPHRT